MLVAERETSRLENCVFGADLNLWISTRHTTVPTPDLETYQPDKFDCISSES
jgi:hypothetical protein